MKELTESLERSFGAGVTSESWGFRLQQQSIWVSQREARATEGHNKTAGGNIKEI